MSTPLTDDNLVKQAVERERRRLAGELHDSVAQDIAHALHRLDYIQQLLDRSQFYKALQEISRVVCILEDSLQHLHSSVDALLPQQLEQNTLSEALRALVHECRQDHSELHIELSIEPHELITRIPARMEISIFRFVQQALNNTWQHAAATHVIIALWFTSDKLMVEVVDNGRGFSIQTRLMEDKTTTRSGLRIMRERVEQAGGTWELQSQPEAGTSVRAIFPL